MEHKIIIGDNLEVMRSMDAESIDLVYADPPFNTGRNFGDYDDRWDSNDAFMEMIRDRLLEMRRLLKPTGSIYLHCDQHMSHYIKVAMDLIFGRGNFRNEIIWCYDNSGRGNKTFAKKHDNIFFYSKAKDYHFQPQKVSPRNPSIFNKIDENGDRYYICGKKYKYYLKDGKIPNDWWDDINDLRWNHEEKNGYQTQKPKALLHRIIQASCPEGGLVLDPFVGSGTTVEAAYDLNRSAIGIDINPDTPAIARIAGLERKLI